MAESAALLVDDILPELPIRQWVVTFPHALRFLFATRPEVMTRVLGIAYRTLASHQIRKAGFGQEEACSGAVTLIQRFGGALNANPHLHMLLLDGVDVSIDDRLRFHRVKAPAKAELETLVHRLSERIGSQLERQGLLVRDLDNSYLALEPHDDDGLAQVLGSSITYRIAFGARQGHKAFMLQTLPAQDEHTRTSERLAKAAGSHSVHPCTSPLRGSLRLCKSAFLPICPCTPAWPPSPGSAINSNVSPATSPGPRSQSNASR